MNGICATARTSWPAAGAVIIGRLSSRGPYAWCNGCSDPDRLFPPVGLALRIGFGQQQSDTLDLAHTWLAIRIKTELVDCVVYDDVAHLFTRPYILLPE